MRKLEVAVGEAVKHFWITREEQERKQGSISGRRDYGGRSSVTGGAQCDGFINLIDELMVESGLPNTAIHTKETVLPGYFRPTKKWDILAVSKDNLIASIEIKSQVGPSFGNNFNNRVEEALGSAYDLWTAYREGMFKPSQRPWLGYIILLEEHPKSVEPVKASSSYFNVLPELLAASYARRYEIFCERLVRERLYDAACLIMSNKVDGIKGEYKEPSKELGFSNFASLLMSHAIAFTKTQG
ncbi:MAG: restriction endonuclease [Chloroflexi bacterium]|nr:restriction endonuclease [Chloroflexota bacterium]